MVKPRKQVDAILENTRKLTKNELRAMIKEVLQELLKDQLYAFLTQNNLVFSMLSEQAQNFFRSWEFRQIIERSIRDDKKTIVRVVEDVVLDVMVEAQAKKRTPKPVGKPRSRKVKL